VTLTDAEILNNWLSISCQPIDHQSGRVSKPVDTLQRVQRFVTHENTENDTLQVALRKIANCQKRLQMQVTILMTIS
jgi:hypothetical protein